MMEPVYSRNGVQIFHGDALEVLKTLPDESVNCCVTSPPYWGLRDYGVAGQLGLEKTPDEYVSKMVDVFREVRRVLTDDGTLWLNLGDSYNGYMANQRATSISENNQHARPVFESGHGRRTDTLKAKDLVGIPWRVAFALQSDGWWLRQDIIWHKPNPMPESVTDRCTKAHEYLFLLAKSERYYYDQDAISEGSVDPPGVSRGGSLSRFGRDEQLISSNAHRGDKLPVSDGKRNKRSVWTVTTLPYPGAHFATFPPKLIEPCILAGCPQGGVVLDPFLGSGTTASVSQNLGRQCIGIELNPEYIALCKKRLKQGVLEFSA